MPALPPATIPSFSVHIAHEGGEFAGTLADLARALRAGELAPSEVSLLRLTEDLLAWLEARKGSLATGTLSLELLPPLSAVIALKTRLLLPTPEPVAEEWDTEWEDEAEDLAGGVALLAELENAVTFLAKKRAERTGLIPAPAPKPGLDLPRRARSASAKAQRGRLERLREAARGAVRDVDVPLLARERLTLQGALSALRSYAARLGHFLLGGITAAGWGERTTYFAALLEAVRLGEVEARQEQPFGEIRVEAVPDVLGRNIPDASGAEA